MELLFSWIYEANNTIITVFLMILVTPPIKQDLDMFSSNHPSLNATPSYLRISGIEHENVTVFMSGITEMKFFRK